MVGLLFALSTFFLLCFLHPFVTYPMSLMLIQLCRGGSRINPLPAAQDESIAVCFCAFNEECIIEAKMQNLLDLRRPLPSLEILAYVDAATDRTAELLRLHADEIKLHTSSERHGKTYGMNLLVDMSEAPIVVFTDANVMLDSAALTNLLRYFADPRVGCVCGHLIYTNPTESAMAATGSLYWRLEEKIKQLETDTGSAMGADGSIFAIRRHLHRRVPEDIIDDMYVSLSILCDGYRVVRAPDVKAYERALTAPSDEFRRKIRIACQAFNVHRLLWTRLRRLDALSLYKYLSHKLLRWLSMCNLVMAAACFAAGLIAAGLMPLALSLAVLGVMTLGLGKRWRLGPMPHLWSILLALTATSVGVWLSLRGERFQTWTPATTIRR
jgi:cellulose synthase/poly-beta-1,6-N-acetylglucosamine synthase-like glycosyltransferase